MERNINLAELIKGNYANFSFYRAGVLYYHIERIGGDGRITVYRFPIPIEDTGNGTFKDRDKAILFMRWIRKAIENDEFMFVYQTMNAVEDAESLIERENAKE